MNVKTFATATISTVVMILIVSAVFIPIMSEAQKVSGEEVVYTNPINSTNPYHYDYAKEVVLTAEAASSYWGNIKVNGQDISVINDYMLAIVSDGFALQIGGNGQLSPSIAAETFETPASYNNSEQTIRIEFKNGHWKVTGGVSGVLNEGDYSWVVTYSENGRYIARNGNPTNFYNNGSPEDFILYGGQYTTGDLDTYYAYGMGKLTAAVAGYEGSISMTNTKVDDTTDVYRCNTCSLTITDGDANETFTPYRALVKETIIGHKDSGATYSLVGVIPLLVLAGLTIGVVGTFIRNRD